MDYAQARRGIASAILMKQESIVRATLDTVLKEYGPERYDQLVHDYLLDLRFNIQPIGPTGVGGL